MTQARLILQAQMELLETVLWLLLALSEFEFINLL